MIPMATKKLYSAIASRIRELKKPNETIWSWSEAPPGEVNVMLLSGRRNRAKDAEFWGASGRCFLFRKINGRWLLTGEGEWRT